MVIPARKTEIGEMPATMFSRSSAGASTCAPLRRVPQKVIDIGHGAAETASDRMFSEMRRVEEEGGEFNLIVMMANFCDRGSKAQIRRLGWYARPEVQSLSGVN